MNQNRIIQLVKSALLDATEASSKACKASTANDLEHVMRSEAGAVMIALRGLSEIQLAESLLVSSGQYDETDTFSDIASAYRAFVEEITDDFATNHSHQWTSIHKTKLLEIASGTEFEVKSPYEQP